MADTPATPPRKKPIPLEPLPRFTVGLFGLAGMLGGGIAVFTRTVEAGPVAMMGIGALFFLMAVVGRMPTRLRIGDNEAEWQEAVAEFVEQTVEDATPEERPALLQRISDLSEALPEAAQPALRSLLYEQQVREMIRIIANDVRPQVLTVIEAGLRGPFDLYVTGPSGRKVAVEILRQASMKTLPMLYERFSHARQALGLERLLIVVADRPTNQVKMYVQDMDNVSLIPVSGPEDAPFLRQTLFRFAGPIES